MSAFKTDGTFTSASAVGAARKSFPFDGDNSSFIVEQDFMIALSSFSPLALSTAHGTYTNAYLVKESPLQDLGGGIVKWTRTYAQIPATRSEYSTFAYTFIGFLGAGIAPYSQYDIQAGDQRDPFLKVVMSRVYNEYFLCATGQTYTTPSAIPVINAQSYNFDGLPNNKVNYLVDPAINPLSTATEPTLPDYRDMVTAGDEIVAEDSTLERWMGNIYVRSTRYVKAL
jgi:hypothetical protein